MFKRSSAIYVNYLSGVLSYVVIGYGLAYGEGNSFIGFNGFALNGVPFSSYTFVFFQVNYIQHL